MFRHFTDQNVITTGLKKCVILRFGPILPSASSQTKPEKYKNVKIIIVFTFYDT